jgi:MFS transporter, DHA1 family, multidrug resistance protein
VALESTPPVGIREVWGNRSVRVVTLVVFVIMLGFGIVAPILPLFARSFGVSYEAASLLISAFAFTRLIFDLVAGPLIDRFGERRCASAGIMFVGVTSVLTGLAPTFPLAVLFRGIGGAGSAVLFAALYSYLLKVVPKERMGRSLSLFYGAFNVGIIAGAPFGGLLARFGLAVPLYAYAAVLFLAGGLYLRFVPDPAPVERAPGAAATPLRPFRARLRELLRDRTFVVIIFLNFTYLWFVAAALDTLVPLFGNEALGLSPGGVGLAFTVLVAVEFAVLYHAGSLSDRFGRKAVELPALVGLCAVVAVTGLVGNVTWFVIVLGVMGIASGYAGVPPGAMLADVAPPESSGTAVGAFRFAGDLGFVLGPLAAGRAAEAFGFGGAFAVTAIPSAVAALLLLGVPETLRRPSVAATGS